MTHRMIVLTCRVIDKTPNKLSSFTDGSPLFLVSSVTALGVALSAYVYVGVKTLRTIHIRRKALIAQTT